MHLYQEIWVRSTVVLKLQFTQILIDSHAFRDMSPSETNAYRVQVQLQFPQDLEGRDEKMFVADTEDQSLNKVVSQCRYHSLCPNRRFLHLCSGVCIILQHPLFLSHSIQNEASQLSYLWPWSWRFNHILAVDCLCCRLSYRNKDTGTGALCLFM